MARLKWSLQTIDAHIPDLAAGSRIEMLRDQEVCIKDREDGQCIIEATDHIYFEDDDDRHTFAAVTCESTLADTSEIKEKDDEALKKLAAPVWRMASFTFAFITQISMGSPTIVPPFVIPEDRRGRRVFGLEASEQE